MSHASLIAAAQYWRADAETYTGSTDFDATTETFAQSFTLAARINADTLADFTGILSNAEGGIFNGFIFYLHGDGTLGSYLGAHRRGTAVIPTGTDTHVALTFNGSTVRHYINGSLDLFAAATITTGTRPTAIAGFLYNGAISAAHRTFDGTIGEVYMDTGVLGLADIGLLAAGALPAPTTQITAHRDTYQDSYQDKAFA